MTPKTSGTSDVKTARQDGKRSLVLCFVFTLAFGSLWLIRLDEPFSQDYDEGVYLCSARMLLRGHPLFTSVFSSQPPAFLEILTIAFYVFGDSIIVGRGLMVFFSLLALAAIGRIAWRVAGPLAAPTSVLLFGFSLLYSPTVTSDGQATIVQAEVPALALALSTIALLLSRQSKWRSTRLVGAGACFMLGVVCKLLVVPMILPVFWLLMPWDSFSDVLQLRTRSFLLQFGLRLSLFAFGCMAVCFLTVSPWNLAAMYDQVVSFHLQAKTRFSPDWYRNVDMIFQRDSVFLLSLLAPVGMVILYWQKAVHVGWLVVWVVATLCFLIDHSPFFGRHVFLLVAPLAVAGSVNICSVPMLLTSETGKLLGHAFVFAGTLLWGVSLSSSILPRLRSEQSDHEVVRLIQEYTCPSDFVISDEQMHVYRSGRLVPAQLCDTSFVRIKGGYLTDQDAIMASKNAKVVIFATGRLDQLPRYREWVEDNYRVVRMSRESGCRFYLKNVE